MRTFLPFRFRESETTMGPHMPTQCPNPTVKPVTRKTRYSGSVDDIEDELDFADLW